MDLLITGASGLLGNRLVSELAPNNEIYYSSRNYDLYNLNSGHSCESR